MEKKEEFFCDISIMLEYLEIAKENDNVPYTDGVVCRYEGCSVSDMEQLIIRRCKFILKES
jgi:hypothetical protein